MIRKEVMKKILKLQQLALKANVPYKKDGEDRNLPTVSAEFSGITARFDVRVFDHGWKQGAVPDMFFTLYTDDLFNESVYIRCKRYLEDLICNIQEVTNVQ